jgi:hypothetical protein
VSYKGCLRVFLPFRLQRPSENLSSIFYNKKILFLYLLDESEARASSPNFRGKTSGEMLQTSGESKTAK